MAGVQEPAGEQDVSSRQQTDLAPSPSVALPTRGAVGEIPNTQQLRELLLQPGEAAGVPDPQYGVRDMHRSELRPLPTKPSPAPCPTMWGLLNQKGAKAAVSQTFEAVEPGSPSITFLASHSATGAAATFARLRTAVAACPMDDSADRKATVRYEDLDAKGFPKDTIRIRMTFTEEGSGKPADVIDRIVSRVGVCIVSMLGMGPEPYPRLSEGSVLRQIERLQAAQGL